MSEINEVRERLERACIAGMDAEYVDDVSVLLADHARLQSQAALAAELLVRMEEYAPAVPEKGCSCHISPPCHDCVDWSGLRELSGQVGEFIAEHGKAVKS